MSKRLPDALWHFVQSEAVSLHKIFNTVIGMEAATDERVQGEARPTFVI